MLKRSLSCLCRRFKNITPGTFIIITLRSGNAVPLTFLSLKDLCVYGVSPNGDSLVLDCKDALSISFPPGGETCIVAVSVPAVIICTDTILGEVTCNGIPIPGVSVSLSDNLGLASFAPNPVVTDQNGHYSTTVFIPAGTDETTVLVTAEAAVGQSLITRTVSTVVSCPLQTCTIDLFTSTSPITCAGLVEGRIACNGQPVDGVPVTLTSSNGAVTFNPANVMTDSEGDFATGVNIASGTPLTNVTITASAPGLSLITNATVDVVCLNTCSITGLTVTPSPVIACTGTISGTFVCGGVGVSGATVTFQEDPSAGLSIPPTTTNASGFFTQTITVPDGTSLTSVVIMATAVAGPNSASADVGVEVDCPIPEPPCPCKFLIGVAGGSAPATATLTRPGVPPSILAGTINVSAVQCYTAGPNCNTAVDSFSVSFASGGTTFNLTQGRRIRISCIGNTQATLEGSALASGTSGLTGIFDVFISISLTGGTATWTVSADNGTGSTFNTTFTSAVTPQTFIGDCSDRP